MHAHRCGNVINVKKIAKLLFYFKYIFSAFVTTNTSHPTTAVCAAGNIRHGQWESNFFAATRSVVVLTDVLTKHTISVKFIKFQPKNQQ